MQTVGIGYDSHKFEENRPLFLGGIKIEYDKGLSGHSDADVLIHALIDALLGASGENDIGTFFPDTDVRYKDISSLILLEETVKLINKKNYKIINVDSVIITQEPKLSPYIKSIKENLSRFLGIKEEFISIKATTNENMGFVGRKEGMASICVVNIDRGNRF